MKNKIIYLAAPYSSQSEQVKEERFNIINECAAKFMNNGFVIFSPISHSHMIAKNHKLPSDYEYWQNSCETFLSHCSMMVVLLMDGWKESKGVTAEIKIAKQLNIPILYFSLDDGHSTLDVK